MPGAKNESAKHRKRYLIGALVLGLILGGVLQYYNSAKPSTSAGAGEPTITALSQRYHSSCSKCPNSCSCTEKGCPMSSEQAHALLVKQQKRQAELLAVTVAKPAPGGSAEYQPGTASSCALTWVSLRSDVGDILEIGASYGAGSTAVLANAKKAQGMGHEVWSLEAVPEKYLNGQAVNKAANLPTRLFLSSAVDPEEMPTIKQRRAVGDQRPAEWLDGEIQLAALHGFGIMKAMCSSHTFGHIFVDGGAFTGNAEWSTINSHCSNVPWISLDDTHAKTVDVVLAVHQGGAATGWEIVYEELNAEGTKMFKGKNYDFSGGTHSGTQWKRWGSSKESNDLKEYVAQNMRNPFVRNYALLRNLKC